MPESPPRITASQLRWLTLCYRRIWLDQYGDPAQRSTLPVAVTFRRVQGNQHELDVLNETIPYKQTITVDDWDNAVATTHQLIEDKIPVIAHAAFESPIFLNITGGKVNLAGQVDLFRRTRQGYQVIEIKQRRTLLPADLLQMDAYIYLIHQTTGKIPEAIFWLGPERNPIPHTYNKERFMTAIQKIVELQQSPNNEPVVDLVASCRICHWQDLCSKQAQQDLHLSLLNGIPKKARQALQDDGIHSLHDLVPLSPDELRQIKGIKTTAERYLAQAQAWVENRPIRYGNLADVCHTDEAWFFDIETNPFKSTVWSIGMSQINGTSSTIVVSPDRAGEVKSVNTLALYFAQDHLHAWQLFSDIVQQDTLPIFHWSGFDAGVMKKAVPDLYEPVQHRLHDLCRIFARTVQVPRQGVSIKTIAPYVGFRWAGYDDWSQAWRDYQQWLRNGHEEQFRHLLQYQMDDVHAMHVILEWLVEEHDE